MSRENMEISRDVPVGHRDSCCLQRPDGGGNARNDLIGDSRLCERLDLLSAAPEHKGISTL